MSVDRPSAVPESLGAGDAERRDVRMHASTGRLHVATGLPPGAPRDGIIRGELNVEYETWSAQCRTTLAAPHAALVGLLPQVEQIPRPVGTDLGRRLRALERLSNPNPAANVRLNPMRVLDEIRSCREYIQGLMAPGAPYAGVLSPYTGTVMQAAGLVEEMGRAAVGPNPNGGR